MSKIKALITALVLGSSSAAMASPSVSFSAEASWGTGSPVLVNPVRDHRVGTTWYGNRPAQRMTWIALAEPMHLYRGRDTIRLQQSIPFNQLRIQSTAGASYIRFVTVRFTDGTRQQITLNRWIDTRNPMLQFNLNSTKRIDRLVIRGSNEGTASYQVFGYGQRRAETPPVYQPPVYQPPAPPVYQPPVYQPPVYQPPVIDGRGLMLATDINFANTDGRRFIDVGASKGTFSTLRIQGIAGTTHIQMVLVRFTDGTEQFLSMVNKTLTRGEFVDLQLDGRGSKAITNLVVWTSDRGQQIPTATGQFNVSAF